MKLTERRNGTGSRVQRTPYATAIFLSAVRARGRTAAGYLTKRTGVGVTLAERWNGTG